MQKGLNQRYGDLGFVEENLLKGLHHPQAPALMRRGHLYLFMTLTACPLAFDMERPKA